MQKPSEMRPSVLVEQLIGVWQFRELLSPDEVRKRLELNEKEDLLKKELLSRLPNDETTKLLVGQLEKEAKIDSIELKKVAAKIVDTINANLQPA